MSKKDVKATKGMSRRAVLTGARAAGSGRSPGPAVWAQEDKGCVTLDGGQSVGRHHQEGEGEWDHNSEHRRNHLMMLTRRVITQPNSFDILDTEYFSLKKLVPSGYIKSPDAKKIKEFDNITPVFTKGQLPSGRRISATRAPRPRR